MNNSRITAVVITVLWTCALTAMAAVIPVANQSFELSGTVNTWNWNDQDGTGLNVIEDWNYDYTAAAWPSDNDTGAFTTGAGASSDGTFRVAFVRHSSGAEANQLTGPWQDLGYTIVAGETYQLSIEVQRRQGGTACSLSFNYHDAGARSNIVQNVIDMTGQAGNSWANYSVQFTAVAGAPYIGKSLGVEFNNESTSDSWQHFDNVRVLTLDTPSIVVDPEDQVVVLGDTNAVVLFSATVEGGTPLFYSWVLDGTPIGGATNASLVISNAGPADVGDYVLSASNSFGTASSAPATLSLTSGPVQPPTQNRHEGDVASFSITMPEDSSGYLYAWRKDGAPIPGENGSSLQISPLAGGDSGVYDVEVTLGADSALSDPATLNVLPPATAFVLIDDFESHVPGDPIDTANGWLAFGADPAGVVVEDPADSRNHAAWLGGAANNEGYLLPLAANTVADGTVGTLFFRLRTTGSISTYLMDTNSLQPPDWWGVDEVGVYNRTQGGPQVLRGHWDHASAVPFPHDTWYNIWVVVDNSTTPSADPGGESYDVYVAQGADDASAVALGAIPTRKLTANVGDLHTLAFLSNDGADGGHIDDIYISTSGISLINPVPPSSAFIVAPPEDRTVVLGDTNAVVTFSAVVAGTPPLSYAWSLNGSPIPGGTNAMLVISNAGPADVGSYAVTASNALGSDTSAPAALTLVTGPVTPTQQLLQQGQTAELAVTMPADSVGYIYQWKKDGVALPGETGPLWATASAQPGDSGTYTVEVTLGPDTVSSGPSELAVLPVATDSYFDIVTGDSPVIYWRLGEASNATVAVDEMGFNDGDYLLVGGTGPQVAVDLGVPGALMDDTNTAGFFAGTEDTKLELFDPVDVETPSITVELWAMPTGGSGFRSPITSRDVFEGDVTGWTMYAADDNTWQWRVGDGAWTVQAGGEAVNGLWTHLVGTYDAGTGTMTFYVDGMPVASQTGVGYSPQAFGNPLWVGAGLTEDQASGGFFWVGNIDEVAIYDRALTTAEVQAHYAGALFRQPIVNMGISLIAGDIVVTWGGTGVLQVGADLGQEPWDDVPAATSPYNAGQPIEPRMNYRLRAP